MHQIVERNRADIVALCRRFGVARLDVFGSAARGADFNRERSDIDLLVAFQRPDADLARFLDFQEALEALIGRSIDLVDREEIESSRNYIRRRQILEGAEAVYAA